MSNDDDNKLNEAHNQGQEDYGEKESRDLPHGSLDRLLSWNAESLAQKEKENTAYEGGWQHAKDQDDKNNSSCYLTTACVASMGLPDNCFELSTLRKFRDTIVSRSEFGKNSVKEYYRIAPDIVKSVNSRSDSSEIWREVYNEIKSIVELIMFGDNQEAMDRYKTMTFRLKNLK